MQFLEMNYAICAGIVDDQKHKDTMYMAHGQRLQKYIIAYLVFLERAIEKWPELIWDRKAIEI